MTRSKFIALDFSIFNIFTTKVSFDYFLHRPHLVFLFSRNCVKQTQFGHVDTEVNSFLSRVCDVGLSREMVASHTCETGGEHVNCSSGN